ncbi:MAG: 2-hydroxyacyl-CoA dehydratase family protein [Candidatus Helarchaeota archaeon]|nr:2-hydroxyacyl-CoA dehydratase family protein [Candidatus Helarchaeota archaeon]
MSIDTEEFLIPSFLNLNLEFFSAQKQIRKFRRNNRQLVGGILPLGAELVFAAGASPIFPLRIGKFEAEKLLRGTRLASNILGSSLTTNILGSSLVQPQAENIISQFLSEYNKNLCEFERNSDDFNYFPNVCFATRIAYGSSLPYKDWVKLFLAWGTRCGWFSQFYGTLHNSIPIAFTDIPKSQGPHAREYMYEELQRLVKRLEALTGNTITEESLREYIILANEIKANYKTVLYYLKTPEKMPLSPYAYMQLLALLSICIVDYISAMKYFHKNLSALVQELNNRRKIDYKPIPKLLLVPVFSGSEPDLPQIVNNLGGCLIQADYLAYGMLDPIKTDGDLIQNYGEYLLNSHEAWRSGKSIVDSWIRLAKDLKVDGVIFNRLVGCTSITPALRLFRDQIRETGIPAINIDFNRIGENLAQVQNQIASFIEILKKE